MTYNVFGGTLNPTLLLYYSACAMPRSCLFCITLKQSCFAKFCTNSRCNWLCVRDFVHWHLHVLTFLHNLRDTSMMIVVGFFVGACDFFAKWL